MCIFHKNMIVMQRKNLNTLWKHIESNRHLILTGARRTGKTTMLKQLYEKTRARYDNVFFLSLESPHLCMMFDEHPENLYKFVTKPPEIVNDVSEKYYVFIDEIQYLKNPSNFLKYNFDFYNNSVKLIVTGSSAFYIDTKFKDSLAGRKWLFEMLTLDFEEFLDFKGFGDLVDDYKKIAATNNLNNVSYNRLKSLLDEYITFGGYPEVVLSNNIDDKTDILKELTHTYMKRDILEAGIMREEHMHKLLKALAENTGSLLNSNYYAKMLQVSPHTIDNYVYILRKCFHIETVVPYYSNAGKSLRKMNKFYFNDLGFRNSLVNDFRNISERQDKGVLFENYVYRKLKDKLDKETMYFWRTSDGNEVDFIMEDRFLNGNAYEVKFSSKEFSPNKYKLFAKAYPGVKLNCISYDESDISINPFAI